MAIRMMPDVVAPLAVTGVNIVSRTTIPEYHDYIVYAMTAAGYLGGWMNWGGEFLKQMGVASLPLTADKLYDRMKGGATRNPTRSNLSFRRTPVSRTYQPEFNAAGAVAY